MLSNFLHLESKIDRFLGGANGGMPVVVYGAGFALPAILGKLELHGFNIAAICDSKPEKQGQRYGGRYDIIGPEEALSKFPDATFIIASPKYFDEIYRDLAAKIDPSRVSDVDLECAHYFNAGEFRQFFLQHKDRLERIIAGLADDGSRETLTRVIRAHLSGEREHFQQASTGNDDWYLFNSLMAPRHGAVYVDCGAHNGDTIKLFAKAASNGYDKIYAFEPDQNMHDALWEMARGDPRISVIEKGAYHKEGILSFNANGMYSALVGGKGEDASMSVHVTTIDGVLDGRRADIIKMDIEGAEYDALLGAEYTIRTYKPRLAICLYHRVDDMVRIPELLRRFHPDYRLYIRHQSESCTDTILFADLGDTC